MDSFFFSHWRLFLVTVILLLISCVNQPSPDQIENVRDRGVVKHSVQEATTGVYVGGYSSKVSVAQGETIDFHVSTTISGLYDLTIWRDGNPREYKETIRDLPGARYSCADGYHTGCGWPVAASFTIPTDWPSGAYIVDVPQQSSTEKILFWVREDDPGSTARILFLSAINTFQAYTNYGGKSVYDYNSSDYEPATKISFDRPLSYGGLENYPYWDRKFPIWAEANGYDLEFASDYDIEFVPDLLTHYDIVIIAGHSEYWTWNMRDQVRSFVNNGGRFLNLSGNTMWWQVRFEDNGRTMVAYKDYRKDPIKDDRTLITDRNWEYPILDSEYSITGGSFYKGGYAPDSNLSIANGYGGFWVQNADHWVFENTNLQSHDIFGRANSEPASVIEHEVDGTTFNCDADGSTILGPLGNTGTPHNFTILAISPAVNPFSPGKIGFATMGLYTVDGGGAVFSANTIGWVTALHDSDVSQITQNILDRFLSSEPLPQEPVASTDTNYLFYDRFNCNQLQNDGLFPYTQEWNTIHNHNYLYTQNAGNARLNDACGVDGSGMQITINHENNMTFQAPVKPNWGDTDKLFTRMNLNLSNLYMCSNDEFDLFRHYHDSLQGISSVQAQIQIRWIDSQPYMRYRPTDLDPPWYPVPQNQPFVFETLWDKESNMISVWVDDVQFDFSADLGDRLPINRVDTVLRGVDGSTSGHICLDEYAFDTRRIGDFDLDRFEVQLSESQSQHAVPGETITMTHQITNTGTTDDAFNFDVASPPLWSVSVEPNLTEGLSPGESTDLILTVQVPSSAQPNTSADVTITATAVSGKSTDSVTDIVHVEQPQTFEVQISGAQVLSALPGETITISHQITNTGTTDDAFNFDVASSPSWSVSVEPNLTAVLSSGESTDLTLTVQVPSSAQPNTSADVTITATAVSGKSTDSVTDIVHVEQPQTFEVQISDDQALSALPGETVTITHQIMNVGTMEDAFTIDMLSDQDWDTTCDPDQTGMLVSGEATELTMVVQVPASALADTKANIAITVSGESGQSSAAVTDVIIVDQTTDINLTDAVSVVGKAGQEVVLAHTITNLSNGSDSFHISASTGTPKWPFTIHPTTVGPLASGEQASFEITVQVPSDLVVSEQKAVTIDITSQEDSGNMVTIIDEIVVERFGVYLPIITTK